MNNVLALLDDVQFNWIDEHAFLSHSADGAFDLGGFAGQFDIHPPRSFTNIGSADIRDDLILMANLIDNRFFDLFFGETNVKS
jgi:hypothetical protein